MIRDAVNRRIHSDIIAVLQLPGKMAVIYSHLIRGSIKLNRAIVHGGGETALAGEGYSSDPK